MSQTTDLEDLRARLYDNLPFYAEHCLKIVNKQARLVPLVPNGPQLRLEAALEAQRQQERPMRAIVLKARKTGISTWVQAKIIHRITQRPHRKALVVAQDGDTASELFEIGDRMYSHLPATRSLNLKPPVYGKRRGKYIRFGNPSKLQREAGLVGIDSTLEIDSAREYEAGRGYTFTEMHLSEVGFWPDVGKMTALVNAVPDELETMIVLESTANGHNHFKVRWDQAVAGESSYAPVFVGWTEDPSLTLRFPSLEDRGEFVAGIGDGPYGDDEPRLVDEFGCTPEQLHWRRQAIVDKCEGKVEVFRQEYPSSPEEAFVGSGRQVFSLVYISKVLDRARLTDPETPTKDNPGPQLGILRPSAIARRKTRSGIIDVPTGAEWVPKRQTGLGSAHPYWRIWEMPELGDERDGQHVPPGRYIVGVDPAEGLTEGDEGAYHGIEVVDHRSRLQVAEYRSRIDPDLLTDQAFLVAVFYNRGWIVPETTGGYGGFMARRIWRDYGYPLVYRRKPIDKTKDRQEDRLGWDTNRVSKVFLEDHARELLREGTHGIRSRGVGLEMTTYVEDDRRRTGPERGCYADRLMAWMIAQYVAMEKPLPADRPRGARTSTGVRQRVNPVTGYGW